MISKGGGSCQTLRPSRIRSSHAAPLQGLGRSSKRDRVAAKYVENEFEKVDRLMELYARYSSRVTAEERRLGTSEEEYTDDEVYNARMDAGLYTLQQVRAYASKSKSKSKSLHGTRGGELSRIIAVLKESVRTG